VVAEIFAMPKLQNPAPQYPSASADTGQHLNLHFKSSSELLVTFFSSRFVEGYIIKVLLHVVDSQVCKVINNISGWLPYSKYSERSRKFWHVFVLLPNYIILFSKLH